MNAADIAASNVFSIHNESVDGNSPAGPSSQGPASTSTNDIQEAYAADVRQAPSSARRVDAIAKLKRAASQRELRGRGGEAAPIDGVGDDEMRAGPSPISNFHPPTAEVESNAKSASPIPAKTRVELLRSESHSPQRGVKDGASTAEGNSPLFRSRSQTKSPLPSLEQLRARILHERASAGLARSASTSAASAAARAYALEKLLGESPREGAVSPVSDTAEDQQEDQMRTGRGSIVAAPDQNNHRHLLRRSRTIGGLSAAAEAQRKAAFVTALDEGMPEEVRSIKRSSRRFAKAPPGGRTSMSSKPSDPPIVENSRTGLAEWAPASQDAELDRSLSQRQIARTEMLRKLSGRGRAGGKSPLPPVAPAPAPVVVEGPTLVDSNAFDGFSDPVVIPQSSVNVQPAVPLSPLTPRSHLLAVPGTSGASLRSPSSRSSTALTFHHEEDRNRASEMARLMGEEAFEYEKLLEMGYSTDDAYDRVASARSGSYVAHSPRSVPDEWQAEQESTPPPSKYVEWSSPEVNAPVTVSLPNTTQTRQEEWVAKHPSVASIPLGLDARRGSSSGDECKEQNGDDVEQLYGDYHPPSTRRAAWPESVASATTSDFSSPKRSTSIKRESGSRFGRARPALMLSPTDHLERIEDVLTPGFLKDFGNPLDYSVSPVEASQGRKLEVDTRSKEDASDSSLTDGEVQQEEPWESDDENYLRKVDEMARKLGKFARRKNTSRPARDAMVQQSSAAQVIAAASDDARTNMSTESQALEPTAFDSPSVLDSSHSQPQVSPSETIPPTSSVPPLTGDAPSAVVPPDPQRLYLPNGKLSPFPGILAGSPSPASSTVSLSAPPSNRKPSPLKMTPSSSARAVDPPEEGATETSEDKRSPNIFSSLRRKASNAAARVNGGGVGGGSSNNPQSDITLSAPSPKKFGSLLRRKPSSSKGTVRSANFEAPAHSRNASLALPGSMDLLKAGPSQSGEVLAEEGTASTGIASRSLLMHHRADQITPGQTNSSASPDPAGLRPVAHAGSLGVPGASLAPATSAALHRYSRILTSTSEPAKYPAIPGVTKQDIADPPRKFLFASPVLQVVSSTSVKDRFLFVFSDLILVAKPIAPVKQEMESDALPTLDWTFSVKNIIDVTQIKQLSVPTDERRHPAKSTVPLMEAFVQDFAWNPDQAIDSVIAQSNLPRTSATIAQLLHQTPELDRLRLTEYLFDSSDGQRREVARVFAGMEKYAGVSIESALRSLLLEMRFPPHRAAFEDLLVTFATRWTSSNRGLIKETFSEQLAVNLVFAIMSLNDALHSHNHPTPGFFSMSMPTWSKDDFLNAFRPRDEAMVLSDRTLARIYSSIRSETIQQALLANEAGPRYAARIRSPGVPTRLIYGVYSSPIRITIPRCDASFTIRLYGQDLAFQPQVLSFEKSATQEFRVMSKMLGTRTLVFIKAGKNARHYQTLFKADGASNDFGLPRSINLTVERAFKQHCFSLTHSNNRKVMFSVEGEAKKRRCVDSIREIMKEQEDGQRNNIAQALSLHVLKEALEETEEPVTAAMGLQRSASSAAASTRSAPSVSMLSRAPSDSRALGVAAGLGAAQGSEMSRQESVSRHYYQSQGASERDLALLAGPDTAAEGRAEETASARPIRGDDLVLTVRQNSLLSLVVAHTFHTSGKLSKRG